MDIGKAFSYVFEDEKWVTKVLIGGLISLIPIFGQLTIIGYGLKIAENIARGVERPLPEWSDFGDLFMRGLYYIIIGIVYSIPLILAACIGGGLLGAFAGATESVNSSSDSIGAAGGAVFGIGILLFYLVFFVLSILTSLVLYPAVARYVATGQLSEAFKFGEVVRMLRTTPGTWIILLLVAILASIVGSLGFVACGIGVLFTLIYARMIDGHALGQVIIQQGLGSPAAVGPVSPYIPPATYQ